MEIQQATIGSSDVRQPVGATGPSVEVLLGTEAEAAVGVATVTVPPHGAMGEHDHGASTAVLVSLSGAAQVVDERGRAVQLAPNTVTTIPVGLRVRVENPHDEEARLLVLFSPPDFARRLAGIPQE